MQVVLICSSSNRIHFLKAELSFIRSPDISPLAICRAWYCTAYMVPSNQVVVGIIELYTGRSLTIVYNLYNCAMFENSTSLMHAKLTIEIYIIFIVVNNDTSRIQIAYKHK